MEAKVLGLLGLYKLAFYDRHSWSTVVQLQAKGFLWWLVKCLFLLSSKLWVDSPPFIWVCFEWERNLFLFFFFLLLNLRLSLSHSPILKLLLHRFRQRTDENLMKKCFQAAVWPRCCCIYHTCTPHQLNSVYVLLFRSAREHVRCTPRLWSEVSHSHISKQHRYSGGSRPGLGTLSATLSTFHRLVGSWGNSGRVLYE